MKQTVFVDTDIVLDLLARREPFYAAAASLFSLAETGDLGLSRLEDAQVFVIEQEASGRKIRVTLPASATSFSVPDGFLRPHTEYKMAIGTVAKDGNSSFIETSFTTARK